MSKVNWKFDEQKSDWDNTVALVNAMGYKPRIPMDSFIACILLSHDGACEREDTDIPLEEYLTVGILGREEGTLSDFDYE